MAIPQGCNQRRSLYFVSDAGAWHCACCRMIRRPSRLSINICDVGGGRVSGSMYTIFKEREAMVFRRERKYS